MTGPEQHAATVPDERLRAQMIHGLNGHDVDPDSCWAIIHRWDELVALASEAERLAGRADELEGLLGDINPDGGAQGIAALIERVDKLERDRAGYLRDFLAASERAEAAEARADELQRNLTFWQDSARHWKELALDQEQRAEQARREADQLRAALRTVRDWVRDGIGTEAETAEAMDSALAGAPSGPSKDFRVGYECAHKHRWWMAPNETPRGCPTCNTSTFAALAGPTSSDGQAEPEPGVQAEETRT